MVLNVPTTVVIASSSHCDSLPKLGDSNVDDKLRKRASSCSIYLQFQVNKY